MVRVADYAGEWTVVRYYSETKGRLTTTFSGMHSHVMVERGRRCMIVPRQEVSQ